LGIQDKGYHDSTGAAMPGWARRNAGSILDLEEKMLDLRRQTLARKIKKDNLHFLGIGSFECIFPPNI
jgi:hypothetical protein